MMKRRPDEAKKEFARGSGGTSISFSEVSPDSEGNLPHHIPKSTFGVKNYLHYFYEDCAGVGHNASSETDIQTKENGWSGSTLFCRLGITFSVVFLCVGTVLLLIGFLVQPKKEDYYEDGFLHRKKENVDFNLFLRSAKWIGAILFCVGGLLLSICICLIGIGKIKYQSEMLEKQKFEDRLQQSISIERQESYTDEYGNVIKHGSYGANEQTYPTRIPMTLREVRSVQPTSGSS